MTMDSDSVHSFLTKCTSVDVGAYPQTYTTYIVMATIDIHNRLELGEWWTEFMKPIIPYNSLVRL